MEDEEESITKSDIAREFLNKDIKERTELVSVKAIKGFSKLMEITERRGWEKIQDKANGFFHLMISYRRKGIDENIKLIHGILISSENQIPMEEEAVDALARQVEKNK